MHDTPVAPVIRVLRRMVGAPSPDEPSDTHLLRCFVNEQDQDAFAALVARHGSMVLGVCRRLSLDHHDAEDSFQVTFLLLARKASSLSDPERLAAWLHGVARRTASRLRSQQSRRQLRETSLGEMAGQIGGEALQDLRPLLDDELQHLPERYRLPLILCYLEGMTHEQAAQKLGCPRETVTTRLRRGRDKLRERLLRRGWNPESLEFSSLLATLGGVTLSRTQVVSCSEDAVALATGISVRSLVPKPLFLLFEGVLRSMFWNQVRNSIVLVLVFGVLGIGTGWMAVRAVAEPPQSASTLPAEPARVDSLQPPAKNKWTVGSLPPVVVETVPASGSTGIDATVTRTLKIRFSKKMKTDRFSLVQLDKKTFPTLTAKPSFDKGGRILSVPVKLESGKTYVLWVNKARFQNCVDEGGRPAVPYLLVFETK